MYLIGFLAGVLKINYLTHGEHKRMKDLQGVKAHASGDRSDCLMLATLGGKGGQAQKWEASVPDMGVRVKLHKIKLGVVGCTKVAKSHQLSVAGKWGKMSKAEQTAFL